ncbi:hypothetical protein [Escherichia coli]|uniref:hypothetical protein n=1 Tax=Escherichia coli TaxID=562 RepID=UPI0018488915|nr:hypothetical protein [Citrobacter freundii]
MKLQPDLWAEYASREITHWEHLAELYLYLELSPFNRALQKAAAIRYCRAGITRRQGIR